MDKAKPRTLTFQLTEEDRTLLQSIAVKQDRSVSSVLRRALRAYAAIELATEAKASKPPRRRTA
jgi:predicted transcriptional regulator